MLIHAALTERVIGLAIEVHRHTGPGLLESLYEDCLCLELHQAGIPFARQVLVPVTYKTTTMRRGFRADIIVDGAVIVEVKAVPALTTDHEDQIRTYLRMTGIRVGLIMNFHAPRLKDGMKGFVV
jgi:GxxExxY protein